MKRPALALAALALATRLALAAEPADLSIYLFDDQTPVADVEVLIDGQLRGRTSEAGAIVLSLPAGARTLVLRRGDQELLSLPLELQEEENAQLIATLQPNAAPRVLIESSHRQGSATVGTQAPQEAGPPGTLSGRIVSTENGAPIAGARVYVSGTPLDIVTDAEGAFRAELPPGDYSISIIAANFSTLTLDGVQIASEQTTERPIELTPAGFELPEFVVLEPFVEGSLAAFVEERRASAAVTDILGAEQISRQGDSDAAGALKRVTGLTLVDGKYVYVRGLGERYSSVLLNGAQIPSPDPTRRVVPLDLFPTDVLSGVVIQKTYSAEMPGEFGGGTIQLRTKSYPEDFLLKFGLSSGYVDGATGEEGLTYEGGSRDWTGFDDGSRSLPGSLADATRDGQFLRPAGPLNPDGFSQEQLQTFGRDLAALGYDTQRESLAPNLGLSFAMGDSYRVGDSLQFGFLSALRYSSSNDIVEEKRRSFGASSSGLQLRNEFDIERSQNNVDLSAFVNLGVDVGEEHSLSLTSMYLHQAEDEARLADGITDSQRLQRTRLQWIENELFSNQLAGEHVLPWQIGANWQYTRAKATRDEPNTREYRRDDDNLDGVFVFSTRNDSNSQTFGNLVDNARNWDVSVDRRFEFGETSALSLLAGLGKLERDREASIRTFRFSGRGAFITPLLQLPQGQVLGPENIGPGLFQISETTRPTDNYFAEQRVDARFLSADLNLFDKWRFTAGLRQEDNFQQVVSDDLTNPNAPPTVGTIDQQDSLPSFAVTWWSGPNSQLRLGFGKSLSRPDFRELAESPFDDPLLDIITVGNPDLKTTEIKNYDLRYEYYFSPTESVSLGAFFKDFLNPIEKTLSSGGSTSIITLQNALAAEVYGVEVDLYKTFDFVEGWSWLQDSFLGRVDWPDYYLGANYAKIESNVDLDPTGTIQTNTSRPLQGASPYVVNFQVGYTHPDGLREWTLLYNIFGERIANTGVQNQPDIYEQSFGQLDFVFKQALGRGFTFKLRLRNLLDPTAEFTQGSEVTREFRKGREIGLSLEWSPKH
jgi:TonB-dependent receptor